MPEDEVATADAATAKHTASVALESLSVSAALPVKGAALEDIVAGTPIALRHVWKPLV